MFLPSQEFIDSEDITVHVNPDYPLPTLSADRTKDLHLYYNEPGEFNTIRTLQCSRVFMYFKPPHPEKTELVLETESHDRYLSKYEDGKFVSERKKRGQWS